MGGLFDVPFRPHAVMLGSSEEEHPGDCRLRAQPLVTAVLSGCVGHCGSAVSSVVSVPGRLAGSTRSEEDTSELQSLTHLVCRLLLEQNEDQLGRHGLVPAPPTAVPPLGAPAFR